MRAYKTSICFMFSTLCCCISSPAAHMIEVRLLHTCCMPVGMLPVVGRSEHACGLMLDACEENSRKGFASRVRVRLSLTSPEHIKYKLKRVVHTDQCRCLSFVNRKQQVQSHVVADVSQHDRAVRASGRHHVTVASACAFWLYSESSLLATSGVQLTSHAAHSRQLDLDGALLAITVDTRHRWQASCSASFVAAMQKPDKQA